MKRSKLFKALCVIMSITVLAVTVPVIRARAAATSATFAVFSDTHYLSDKLYDVNSAAWANYLETTHREMEQAGALVDRALEVSEHYLQEAKLNNSAYVLVPGDITKDGEYESHIEMAEKFAAFEEETGIPVFVIPGNHDIRNSNATDYSGEKSVKAKKTQPADFEKIYKDFGYDENDPDCISRFHPKSGKLGGGLSYSWKLNDDFMLIAVDSNKYSTDNGAPTNEHVTDGMIGEDLMNWIKDQGAYAKENGYKIVFMQHHNIVQHMDIEEATFFAFVIDNWEYVCDTYADAGIHYVFTGHLHSHDTASYVNDNGERVTDLLTATLTGYPNEMRIAKFTAAGDEISMDMRSHSVDELSPVSYVRNGETITYAQPFKYTSSYDMTFGKDIYEFAYSAILGVIRNYFPQIQKAGGLVGFLSEKGINLEEIITNALGTNGLQIGSTEILTVSQNLMGFINELGSQIDARYINDREHTLEVVSDLLTTLLSFEVSDKPCTLYYEKTGHGNPNGPTTLDEFAQTALLSYYGGDEDISADPMIQDVLDRFETGELAQEFFTLLRKTVVEDFALNEVLANLDFNPGELFPDGTALAVLGDILQGITEALLGGDNSFLNLVTSVLGIVFVPEKYSSVDNIIDTLIGNEHFTPSQMQAWGHTVSWMVGTLLIDKNPTEKVDGDYTLVYSGKEKVEATADNYRLPSDIAVTPGADCSTQANFTWLTKYSVTASDIEIVPYSENPSFGRGANDGLDIQSSSKTVTISYPGADLGIIAFLDFNKEYTRHYVTVSNLEPGKKYSYRIGDASRGWWSETGTLQTADNTDKTAFIALADMQGQNDTQYGVFADVLKTAFKTVPDAKFVVSAGSQVTLAKNCKHWKSFFNTAAGSLINTFFMPAAGAREKAGGYVSEYFSLANVPVQKTDTGVYYSYDYNNIHFTVLNTNNLADKKLGEPQLNWLKEDVSSSDADWKVVVLPKAIYSNGANSTAKENKNIRAQLNGLLPYLGVDLVLQGQDCVYWRTGALSGGLPAISGKDNVTYNGSQYKAMVNPQGTVYALPGTAGVKRAAAVNSTSGDFPDAEVSFVPDAPMFAAVRTDGDTLYYDAYKVIDGKAERADSFAISKTGGSGAGSFFNLLASKLDLSFLWKIIGIFFRIFSIFTK